MNHIYLRLLELFKPALIIMSNISSGICSGLYALTDFLSEIAFKVSILYPLSFIPNYMLLTA